jgi:ribonuclease HII
MANDPNTLARLGFDPAECAGGVDEAGRGPLAGPVVAAAVILDPSRPIEGLADSKKLNERKRESLFELITERALSYCVAEASVQEIDRLNILQATLLAMQRAVEGLSIQPTRVWVDGNRLPKLQVHAQAVVKGDSLLDCISAASILAKVTRDRWCRQIHQELPQYGFAEHKGYGTALHMKALQMHGASAWHRRSFAPVALAIKAHS